MRISVEKVADQIHKGRMYHAGSSPFALVLDDMLATLTENQYKHSQPLSTKTREWLFDTTQMMSSLYQNEDPFHDPLGDVYEAMVSKYGRDALGQFFTPWHVCKLMSILSMPSASAIIDTYHNEDRLTSFNEPAVGSGRLALAPMQNLFLDNPESCKYMHLVLVDKDITCVKMTAINFISAYLYHGIQPGWLQILHGDTLTMDVSLFMDTHDSGVESAITNIGKGISPLIAA